MRACRVKYNTARVFGLGESEKSGTNVFIYQNCGIEEGADGLAKGKRPETVNICDSPREAGDGRRCMQCQPP